MSDFVRTCESAADRTREFFASRNIPVVCFHYEIDDVVYTDDLYQSISPDEFFAQIAAGAMPKTSQVSVGEYEEFWEPFVAEGKDVLHLTLSSGISGTYGSACVAAQMLADRYPQGGKVRVIDSLGASSGFGLLLEYAADVRDSGASLDETAAWIEEHKLNLHHWFFSTDLSSYLRGGRISAASAIIGTALKICPLITVDCEVGGGTTTGKRSVQMAAVSEMQGAAGCVVNSPATAEMVEHITNIADIPVIATVVRCDDDAHAKVRAGAKILNIAAGKNTPQVLRELREHYPNLPLIAPGGKTPESIRETIAAGANAIIWTPPSAQQLQTDMMQRYRKMKEDATPVISRDDVPIIDQVAAAEVSQVENMNPDVPIPDEVIERVASIHERVEEHRANRGLKPSLHGFFFRGKKR